MRTECTQTNRWTNGRTHTCTLPKLMYFMIDSPIHRIAFLSRPIQGRHQFLERESCLLPGYFFRAWTENLTSWFESGFEFESRFGFAHHCSGFTVLVIQWRAKVVHIFFFLFFSWPLRGSRTNFGTSRFCEMESSNCLIFSEEISLTVSE